MKEFVKTIELIWEIWKVSCGVALIGIGIWAFFVHPQVTKWRGK